MAHYTVLDTIDGGGGGAPSGAAGGDLTGTYPNPTLAANSVSNADLRDSGALSVIGRSANSAGDPADISATAATGAVLRESGSVLGFGTITGAGIAANTITEDKLDTTRVLDRQTLGAAAQELTITVAGNTDERVIIEGFGESDATGTAVVKFNGTTLNQTTVISADGGAPSGAGTFIGASIADEAMGFTMVLDLRATGTADRGGTVHWWISHGAAAEEQYISSVGFKNSADEVTEIKITGSVANFFAAGFKLITRRQRMSA